MLVPLERGLALDVELLQTSWPWMAPLLLRELKPVQSMLAVLCMLKVPLTLVIFPIAGLERVC